LINLDAVKYYRNQRERKLYLIDKLLKKRQYNTGRAFIVFKSSQQVRKATDPSFFQAVYELDNVLIDRLNILEWKIRQSWAQSDIIWGNLNKSRVYSKIKRFIIIVSTLCISVFLLAPDLVYERSKFILNYLK